MTNKELAALVLELQTQLVALRTEFEEYKVASPKTRDYGPQSEGKMTDDHAERIMIGDLREWPHKAVAKFLGLSYGQVYSARKGYTFKPVYQKMIKGQFLEVELTALDAAEVTEDQATLNEITEGVA